MARISRQKGAGGKLARTETVTIRLDPKTRYLAELAGRVHRRTTSSFIEWAIEESLSRVHVTSGKSIADIATVLWDVDEADRFIALATEFPELLTHKEQLIWKHIRTARRYWRGHFVERPGGNQWFWDTSSPENLIRSEIRRTWLGILAIADGNQFPWDLPEVKAALLTNLPTDYVGWHPDESHSTEVWLDMQDPHRGEE